MTLALSMLTMKTLETVAREIERQMYGQWNHCAIYESDLQRLYPHTGLAEMARATERLDRKVDAIKKTVPFGRLLYAGPMSRAGCAQTTVQIRKEVR